MKSEKEKMISGRPYKALDEGFLLANTRYCIGEESEQSLPIMKIIEFIKEEAVQNNAHFLYA